MRPLQDLTARARIRDAAMAEFADRGTGAATIRGIAARAGVSPALVQHHFGTKDGLRAACDDRALEHFRSWTEVGLRQDGLDEPQFLGRATEATTPVARYLARALVDGSAGAESMFAELVTLTEGHLADRPGLADRRTRAIVYTGMRMGALVLREQIHRLLGPELTDAEAGAQVARATLDIVSPELLPDGLTDRLRRAMASDPTATTHGPSDTPPTGQE